MPCAQEFATGSDSLYPDTGSIDPGQNGALVGRRLPPYEGGLRLGLQGRPLAVACQSTDLHTMCWGSGSMTMPNQQLEAHVRRQDCFALHWTR